MILTNRAFSQTFGGANDMALTQAALPEDSHRFFGVRAIPARAHTCKREDLDGNATLP